MKENTLNKSFSIFYSQKAFYTKILAVCCLFSLYACRAKKPLAVRKAVTADTTVAVKTVDPKILKLNAIKASQTAFNTFSGKARTVLDINGESNDVTLNIRIQRDKKIWVSVTAIAGIEVFRALITPDSVFLINRMQNLYVKQPFTYLNKYAGKQLNYKMLESILIGNAVPEALNENSDVQTTNGSTSVAGSLSGLIYNSVFGADNRVNHLTLNTEDAGQSLQVTNGVFIQVGARVLPSQIEMSSVAANKKIKVNLHYIKEEFEMPLEFPFSIPARYQPAQ